MRAIICLALSVVLNAAYSAGAISHGPRELGIIMLEGLTIKDGKVVIRVGSGNKRSLKADVRKEKSPFPQSHYAITFRRVVIAESKSIPWGSVNIEYDIEKEFGIVGLYSVSVTNPISPMSEDAAASKVQFGRDLVGATVQAIDLELAKIEIRQKAAKDDVAAAKLNKQKKELQKQRARFKRIHPVTYIELPVKPAAPGDVLTEPAGPIAPARKITVSAVIKDGCKVGADLQVDGMTKSGPFYHVVGIAPSVQRKLPPGKHVQLTLYLVLKRDYFGLIPNYCVYIADVKALPATTTILPQMKNAVLAKLLNASVVFERPPANEFKIENSEYGPIGFQVKRAKQSPAKSLLFFGQRADGDAVQDGTKVFGKQQAAGDWLLQQGKEAVWVTGIAAPTVKTPVVVHGLVSEVHGAIQLKGIHVFKTAGRKGKEARTLKKGERLFLGLFSSKSTYEDITMKGDSVKRCFQSNHCVVFEAVKPGRTKVAVYQLWSMNIGGERKCMEFEIVVHE